MKLIKSLLGALGAAALSASPALARVESNTGELLKHISKAGVEVLINKNCNHRGGGYLGMYQYTSNLSQARVTLCPGDTVDAEDHETVRHEVMHVIQSCVNLRRGTPPNTPVLDYDDLVKRVNSTVPSYDVDHIHSTYPQEKWAVEYEAFYAEYAFTATDLIELFDKACMKS